MTPQTRGHYRKKGKTLSSQFMIRVTPNERAILETVAGDYALSTWVRQYLVDNVISKYGKGDEIPE